MPKTRRRTTSDPSQCQLCQQQGSCVWNTFLNCYLCWHCGTQKPYATPNTLLIGQPQKRLPAFSFEYEVARPVDKPYEVVQRAQVLLKYGFQRTGDGSVDDEYKSPIYQNLRAFRTLLPILHELRDLVTDSCGTHLHVACQHKTQLHSIHAEVFSRLLTHMLAHQEETIAFWGRSFGQYATPFNTNRYHCFNLDGTHPTLEFRLPRFRDAAQYLRVVKFARTVVAFLDTVLAKRDVCPLKVSERAALGQHVLHCYLTHVALQQQETSWYASLDQEERDKLHHPQEVDASQDASEEEEPW